jgi:hypothetical protein
MKVKYYFWHDSFRGYGEISEEEIMDLIKEKERNNYEDCVDLRGFKIEKIEI